MPLIRRVFFEVWCLNSLYALLFLLSILSVLPVAATAGATEQALLAADGAADDYFGYAVEISGDYAIVGVPYSDDPGSGVDSGSAYIYHFDGATWVEQQKLLPSNGAANSFFGVSVAISGVYAIVGAYGQANYKGSAYVFRYNGNSWVQQQRLTAADGAVNDLFGYSVGISGETAIVGAYGENHRGTYSGSAYIFTFNGTSWLQTAELIASDGAAYDYLGMDVAISGNDAIVGAYQNDGQAVDAGAAYIFHYNGTSWIQQQKLTASDAAIGDFFGWSVRVSGDNLIVGAVTDENNGYFAGSAYIYHNNGSNWVQQQKLIPSAVNGDEGFGNAVAISGNSAIVGFYGDRISSGSASIYNFDGVNWVEQQTITAANPTLYFGFAVGISGDSTIVGAPGADINGAWSGSAFIVSLTSPDRIGAYHQGNWYLDLNNNGVWEPGNDFSGSFGTGAMTPVAGDWLGDGHDRIAVYVNGEWYFDLNGNGLWDGEPTDRRVTAFGAPSDIPVAGDWNGDGVAEIGIYRPDNYTWYLDYDGNFSYDPSVDIGQAFGFAGCIPVIGDWNGTGRDKIGVYSGGQWYLDTNGSFGWDGSPGDTFVPAFGVAGMLPVVGDWSNSGVDRIGAYANGDWYLDLDGNGIWSWDPATDKYLGPFGVTGMLPMVGRW